MEARSTVLVVGSYMEDQVFSCTAAPRAGETVRGNYARGAGGKGSNQAVAAARMGARVVFVGAIGDDPAGRSAQAFHAAERTSCRWIVKPQAATGVASIWVDASGENRIVIAPGANELLAADDVTAELLGTAALVVTQWEGDLAATEQILAGARAAGAATLLNPAPFVAGFKRAMLRHLDILIANETEFGGLAGAAEAEILALPFAALHERCRALDVPTVIVTLGARGCVVSTPAAWRHFPGHAGIAVVDTTGAGDAFCGAFAAAWVETGGQVFAAARLANAAAALCVTGPGTAQSMPGRAAVEAFLQGQGPTS